MPAYVIRGPKIPLSWSTVTSSGYVVESSDSDEKCDQVLIEDEESVYVTEITKLREMTERTLEVMPLTGVSTPPVPGDIFTYDDKAVSVTSIKKSRKKGEAMKWTITGNFLPAVHGS